MIVVLLSQRISTKAQSWSDFSWTMVSPRSPISVSAAILRNSAISLALEVAPPAFTRNVASVESWASPVQEKQ